MAGRKVCSHSCGLASSVLIGLIMEASINTQTSGKDVRSHNSLYRCEALTDQKLMSLIFLDKTAAN